MSESPEAKLKELQKSVEAKMLGMHELSQLLKNEAMRMLELKTVFSSKEYQKIIHKLPGNQKLQEYDEYRDLISKDLCEKIEGSVKSLKELKKGMSTLSTEIKTKKAENAQNKIASFNAKLQVLFSEFGEIWTQGSFLICNYRLDIAAKQVNRWSQGLNTNFNEEDIRKQVSGLFK